MSVTEALITPVSVTLRDTWVRSAINSFLSRSDDVGEKYTSLYPTVREVYLKLLSVGLRALVYNGDTDMACNFLGDQWFVEDLGMKVGTLLRWNVFFILNGFLRKLQSNTHLPTAQMTTEYHTWIYDDQIAGFYQQFGNITFLTVKVTTSVFFFFFFKCLP